MHRLALSAKIKGQLKCLFQRVYLLRIVERKKGRSLVKKEPEESSLGRNVKIKLVVELYNFVTKICFLQAILVCTCILT